MFGFQALTFQKRDLESVVNVGKASISLLMKTPVKLLTRFKIYESLAVKIYDLQFASPVTFAAYEAHLPLITLFLNVGVGGGCRVLINDLKSGSTEATASSINIERNKGIKDVEI